MSQIPPERKFLPNYAWFDYIRPIDKNDIFNWRGKKAGTELKEEKRREAPLRRFGDNGSAADKEPAGAGTAVSEPAEQDETPANKSEQTAADGDIL